MNFISSCFLACCNCFCTPDIDVADGFVWTETIHGDGVTLHRVSGERDASFDAICKMYKLGEEALAEQLDSMVLWCIYDEKNTPVGAIQIDLFSSLDALNEQVTDAELAAKIFSHGRTFELSYALEDTYQGRGLGSKAVKAWVEHARQNGWSRYLFAVVDPNNEASVRILERNSFSYLGQYTHEKVSEQVSLYIAESI